MGFWAKLGDIVYEATEPANEALVAAARSLVAAVIVLLEILLAGFGIYVLYMIIKALIGF
jgi:hypothetical protein